EAATQVAGIYQRIDDPLLAERAADVLDVGNRVRAALDTDRAAFANEDDDDSQPRILVADELAPSQTVSLAPAGIAGIATARGSATAHAAIIARAFGIPAVVGLGEAI